MSLFSFNMRDLVCSAAALFAAVIVAQPAQAAFHLWNIQEIYTNSSGSLQFIELQTASGSEVFVGGQQIQSSNVGNTLTNTFIVPGGNLPSSTAGKTLLFGTAGIQAAGGPAPDYIIPNNFLFSAGGSILFFGSNSGPFTALPTDGTLSRTWGGGDAVNSPKNFAGQAGTVVVPEPATMALLCACGMGGMLLMSRRRQVVLNR